MNTFNSLKSKIAAVSALVFIIDQHSYGQNGDANAMIGQANQTLSTLGSNIVSLVTLIMGLVGIVFVAVNLVKYFKEQGQSDNSLLKVGGGLLIGAILITVIKNVFLKGA